MLKNILMDLDDTILDFRKAERTALQKTLLHLGVEPREEILVRYSQINQDQWKLLEQGRLTPAQVKVRRYRLLFEELGIRRSAGEATAYYEKRLAEGHDYIPGAETVLQMLSGEYRLYIATNGTAAVQHRRIRDAGMGKYLSGLFISEEIGYKKPDGEFFRACFAQIPDFCPDEAVMVGDSLTSDIRGGRNGGIRTVWYNPAGAGCTPEERPDYEIRQLSELAPLLRTIE